MAEQRQETHPKQVQVEQHPLGEGGKGPAEESPRVHEPGFTDQQVQMVSEQRYLIPHSQGTQPPGPVQVYPGQQAMQQHGALPTTTQPTNQPINQPALQATVLEKKEGGFGGATIRIQDTGLAAAAIVGGVTVGASYVASQATQSAAGIIGTGLAAGAMSLAAFYLANRLKTDKAICKAVEKDGHIEVEGIEGGSLLVRVKFLSQAGYWILRSLNERLHQGTDRTCLQLLLEDELQRVGWTGPIQVGLQGWSFEEKEEGQKEEEAVGTEQEEERWEWTGMMKKQSVPPSVTTEGDSGLPEDVSSVAAMSISSDGEVEEGPLKWLRARLQKHKNSPTAQRYINAYRSWEKGAEILTSSGFTDLEGVKAVVLGFMQHEMVSPSSTYTLLYEQSCLNLNEAQLKQLLTSQLQADPTDSTCLLLTALQLPDGDSRVQTLQQVVDAIQQHGPGDWLYQHLHNIYCYLGWAIWTAIPHLKYKMLSKPFIGSDLPTGVAKALSAMASSLMYKQDYSETVYYTAQLSEELSETESIRQFEHYLRLAPECDRCVPPAHYRLATLYGHQQDRQKVIHHFTRGQQTEANRLPGFSEVPRSTKDPAKKAYEEAMAQNT